jgi:hypothetical protein
MFGAKAFETFAQSLEQRGRLTEADLVRRCAEDPLAVSLVPENPSWDDPHRLMAAVQLLILHGVVPDYRHQTDQWEAFQSTLDAHREWIAHFVQHQNIQTNEPQRCFALLPIFLTVARLSGRPLDLLELGTSGGLNLLWDHYQYRYRDGTWGASEAGLELTGDEAHNGHVPADLLQQQVEVRSRRGIDLNPVDVGSAEGIRLLESFVLGDPVRTARLHQATAVVRRCPPELFRGNYLDVLPDFLTRQADDALTVIFQTISTIYLALDLRLRLNGIIESVGRKRSLAWITTPTPEEHGQRLGDYPLELTIWPPGEKRTVARME